MNWLPIPKQQNTESATLKNNIPNSTTIMKHFCTNLRSMHRNYTWKTKNYWKKYNDLN